MKEIKDRLQRIFTRHIARALSSMDVGEASNNMKLAVKGEFWNTMEDVLMAMQEGNASKAKEVDENGRW